MIQIKIGKDFLDINQDLNIALQKKFADLSDPQSRGASLVYDFEIPITNKNKRILDYVDSPHTILTDIKQKKIAEIYADGILISEGELSVKAIKSDSFVCEIINPENSWLTFFENTNLNQVNWNDELCQGLAAFTPIVRSGHTHKYCMPLVDYGNLTDVAVNAGQVYWSDVFPAVFVYPLLQQLFKQAGYTLKSSFFEQGNGELNENLCIPFGLDYLKPKDPTLQTDDVDYVHATASPGLNNLPIGIPTLLKVDNVLKNKNSYLKAFSFPFVFWDVSFEWQDDDYGAITCGNNRTLPVEVSLEIEYTRTTPVPLGVNILVETLLDGAVVHGQTFYNSGSYVKINYKYSLQVAGTQNIQIKLTNLSPGHVSQINTATLYITRLKLADKYDTEGLRFYLRDTLPDVTAYDFLKDLMLLFNLYTITENTSRIVHLEKYEKIRNPKEFVIDDWRNRCSREDNVVTLLQSQLPAITIYQYASASDYMCETYEKANLYPYGYYIHNNPYSNNSGEIKEVSCTVIAPTVMGFFTLLYVPQYWDNDYTNASPGDTITMNTGIGVRLLKYITPKESAEVQNVVINSEYGYPVFNNTGNWIYPTAIFEIDYQKIKQKYTFAPAVTPEPSPFNHHNLKFSNMLTTNTHPLGLFDKYHKSMQATLSVAKTATLRVRIYPKDYFFADLFSRIKLINITIDNSTYTTPAYLNEIKTYIPNINQLTECEFLIL